MACTWSCLAARTILVCPLQRPPGTTGSLQSEHRSAASFPMLDILLQALIFVRVKVHFLEVSVKNCGAATYLMVRFQ